MGQDQPLNQSLHFLVTERKLDELDEYIEQSAIFEDRSHFLRYCLNQGLSRDPYEDAR